MRTILGNWSDLNLDALNVAEPVTAPVLVSSSSIVKYEEIDQNDDGSITIINPKIMNNGGFLPVGSHSDLNGVCRLYGYATYVYNSAIPYGNFSETALINKDGRFNEIGTSPMFQSRNAIITKITCSNDTQNTPIFKRYDELERNSGGSVTIINPKFGPVEDAVLPLSSHSDLNGVCRLYGYATYVYNSAIPYGNFSETALINEDGRFNKIGTPLMFQSRNAIITKIICR
jgi:hypothetical protein